MSSVFVEIKGRYPQMNEAMQKIADYVLANGDEIAYQKAGEFADKSGVSAASVSRFVKLLGYKNFNEFQLKLAASNDRSTKEEESVAGELAYNGKIVGKTTKEICQTIFSRGIRVIEETWGILDFEVVEQVAEKIDTANRIVVIGVGRSKLTTQAIVSRLYRIGYNIIDYSDSHEIVNVTSIIKPGDLLIAVSNFGQSKAVVEGAKRAKKNGADVVGITSVTDSPLAKAADHILLSAYDYASDKMGRLYEPSAENAAQFILVDCLYMIVAMKHEKENMERYRLFSEEIESEHVK